MIKLLYLVASIIWGAMQYMDGPFYDEKYYRYAKLPVGEMIDESILRQLDSIYDRRKSNDTDSVFSLESLKWAPHTTFHRLNFYHNDDTFFRDANRNLNLDSTLWIVENITTQPQRNYYLVHSDKRNYLIHKSLIYQVFKPLQAYRTVYYEYDPMAMAFYYPDIFHRQENGTISIIPENSSIYYNYVE